MVTAIKESPEGARGGKPTGVPNPQERGVLADTARRKQASVGWKIVTEPAPARGSHPTKPVPQHVSDANGAKWTSPTGTIRIQLTCAAARRRASSHRKARRAGEERAGWAQYRLHRGKADFFVARPVCRA